MKMKLLLISSAFLVSPSLSQAREKSERFLSLFSVVQFRNSECLHNTSLGLCVTASQVSLYPLLVQSRAVWHHVMWSGQCLETPGGSPHSSCAAGFGVCCVVRLSDCGSSVDLNGTYISQPTTTQVTPLRPPFQTPFSVFSPAVPTPSLRDRRSAPSDWTLLSSTWAVLLTTPPPTWGGDAPQTISTLSGQDTLLSSLLSSL